MLNDDDDLRHFHASHSFGVFLDVYWMTARRGLVVFLFLGFKTDVKGRQSSSRRDTALLPHSVVDCQVQQELKTWVLTLSKVTSSFIPSGYIPQASMSISIRQRKTRRFRFKRRRGFRPGVVEPGCPFSAVTIEPRSERLTAQTETRCCCCFSSFFFISKLTFFFVCLFDLDTLSFYREELIRPF